MKQENKLHHSVFNIIVVVAALGYFVDIYDLLLFGIVRRSSLEALGFSGDDLLSKGFYLLNCQMGGMLLGGILWGIIGDKRGRLSVLFGSIFLYSLANILNGSVHSLQLYAVYRFIAGVGLAGELGAGITLVSEVMTKERRGYGTTLVASFGIFGAVIAGMVGNLFDWRTAYYIGGALGIALLILRIGAYESGMFHQSKKEGVARGNFLSLFSNRARFLRYLRVILIGVPIWFVIGILIFSGQEFAQKMGIALNAENKTTITNATTIAWHYAGAALGALFCGLLSQYMQKRKTALWIFIAADFICVFVFLSMQGASAEIFYWFVFAFGLANGYWSVFMTVASEQFGTNIRATVTTTTPNFVRGSVLLITLLFQWLALSTGNILTAALYLGSLVFVLSLISLWFTKETFGVDLDYTELL